MKSDAEFLTSFERCTLPFDQWTHRSHVRVAFLYASRLSLDDAIERMRSGIQSYNRANSRPESTTEGYHETITQAFMRLVHAAIAIDGHDGDSDQFCDAHPELLSPSVLGQYYSREHLMTPDGKVGFVVPDKAPLPVLPRDGLVIMHATEDRALKVARRLFREFAGSLDFDLEFQDFEGELADLPGKYAAPRGRLLLAFDHQSPAGCVALRPLDGQSCEMKRLWVGPSFRGRGVGRELVRMLLAEARRSGYQHVLLDTVRSMSAAIQLYRSFGFQETAPYTHHPLPDAIFLQRSFDQECEVC